jgi:hypothetical protein
MSNYFLLQDKSSTLKVELFPSLELNESDQYVLGLDYFTAVNSLKNVTCENNEFVYYTGLEAKDHDYLESATVLQNTNEIKTDKEIYKTVLRYFSEQSNIKKHTIKLEPGAYEYEGLLKLIRETATLQQDAFDVKVQENGKFKFLMNGSVAIDFKNSGIRELFGAEEKIYWNTTSAKDVFNIWDISTLQIFCNLIEGAFINGKRTHLLYSFPLIDENGHLIVEKPSHVLYFPINTNIISTIIVEIFDQKLRKVDFGAEEVSVALHLKKQL